MIRNLELKDVPYMYEWMQDRRITWDLQQDFASMCREDAVRFIERYANPAEADVALHYAVVNEHDEYMGTVSLKNINRRDKNAEYAIIIRWNAHGKGFAQAATSDILKKGFNELGLEKIYLYVSTENIVANKFYQKFGFKEEGVFRKFMMIDGELHDIRWYSMLREDYAGRE